MRSTDEAIVSLRWPLLKSFMSSNLRQAVQKHKTFDFIFFFSKWFLLAAKPKNNRCSADVQCDLCNGWIRNYRLKRRIMVAYKCTIHFRNPASQSTLILIRSWPRLMYFWMCITMMFFQPTKFINLCKATVPILSRHFSFCYPFKSLHLLAVTSWLILM